jgi:regulator of nucleoside diphosphate kinase
VTADPVTGGSFSCEATMQNFEPTLIISDTDRERLLSLIDVHDTPASERLAGELHRAVVVPPREVPADIVTMNSEVVYEDCETFTRRKVAIVYPKDADATRGRISVLAPIGSALLGLRVGQSIAWDVPGGQKRIRVVEVHYQPEACGDFER